MTTVNPFLLFFRFAPVFTVCVSACLAPVQAAASKQPNILFLVADDLSWHSMGYAGDPLVKTPNVDRLAREGVTFTRAAVTTSICMVSRASLLTGQWLCQMGGSRVTPQTWAHTWPARLRTSGYYGGHIGKVHVTGQKAEDYDFWAGRDGYAWLDDGKGGKIHSIQKDTQEALRFLASRPKERPFFLQVAYTVPHAEDRDPAQYLPMPEELSLYDGARVPVAATATEEAWLNLPGILRQENNESRRRWKMRFDTPEKYQAYTKNYYRLISGMDRSIGAILDQLKQQGVEDNTIVVFTGDNGYFLGEHGLADKWYAYEESLRVPLVVFDPRLPAARRGQCCDDWVLNVDLAPTFCAWAGLPVPEAMRGRDIRPLVEGRTPFDWRNDFLYEFKWSSEIIPASEGVCSKEWKYIRWVVSGEEELFDLRSDPLETKNLSGSRQHAAELNRMRSRLAALRTELGGTPVAQLQHMPSGYPRSKGKAK